MQCSPEHGQPIKWWDLAWAVEQLLSKWPVAHCNREFPQFQPRPVELPQFPPEEFLLNHFSVARLGTRAPGTAGEVTAQTPCVSQSCTAHPEEDKSIIYKHCHHFLLYTYGSSATLGRFKTVAFLHPCCDVRDVSWGCPFGRNHLGSMVY